MQPQPFSAIKKVHGAKELLDIAFYNASKVSVSFSSQDTPLEKAKKREEARVRAASKILESRLMKVVKLDHSSLDNVSEGATIGDRCIVRSFSIIYDRVRIGDDVELGHGVLVRSNSTIGSRSRIGSYTQLDGEV
ncbi:MAG: hypothetical protein QXZ06_03605, partial [Candidatus Jordarchaeales archaeon]